MEADCTICDTRFHNTDKDEDGIPEILGRPCTDEFCDVWICSAGCMEHFSFVCESCSRRFCNQHLVHLFGLKMCMPCALEAWAQEPEPDCSCMQRDVDLFDAHGCEFHDPASGWNELRRSILSMQEEQRPRSNAA